jgi:CubicO group peptidase (beta-lactamase class C family)
LTGVFSTTKGLSTMTLPVPNARGWLDCDAPVARYWPEFAQNRKAGSVPRRSESGSASIRSRPSTHE